MTKVFMDYLGLGGPRGEHCEHAINPRMVVSLPRPETVEGGEVHGAGPGRRRGSRCNSEVEDEQLYAGRKPRRAAAAAAAFLTASVRDDSDEDEPAYRGSKRRGRGVAAMAHNYQMTYGNDGWAALLRGGEEGAGASGVPATDGAAPPAKRPRGRLPSSAAGACAVDTFDGAGATALAPAGHVSGGSKFFPKEFQVRLASF